jgi:pimeloyl-ACP methyl ester carboxylesterase
MIGQPMDASGFGTLASHFPDRTVVTYDPRGLGRSTRRDGRVDHSPTVQASDVHAVIEALGAGPVEMFASSGGAVTALALVAALSRRRGHSGGTRAAAHPGAPRRRSGRARPRRRARRVRGQGVECRHGALHRDDVVARRVHRRVLRPAPGGSRRVRNGERGRRLPRRSAAVRPVLGGQQLSPRRRRAGRGASAHRHRRGRGVRGHLHRTHGAGHAGDRSAGVRAPATTAASSAASSDTPANPKPSRTNFATSSTTTDRRVPASQRQEPTTSSSRLRKPAAALLLPRGNQQSLPWLLMACGLVVGLGPLRPPACC